MSLESKGRVKKLVTLSVTSTSRTVAREKAVGENLGSNLAQVPYIYYPINFGKKSMLVLFDSGNEVNALHLAFSKKLGFPMRLTDIGTQKIDDTTLETYEMVVAAFSVKGKANRVRFFEEIFLMVNVSPEVVLGMSFLTLNGAHIGFLGREDLYY